MGSHESAASGALLYFFLVMPYDGQQLGICYGSVNDGQWGAYSVFFVPCEFRFDTMDNCQYRNKASLLGLFTNNFPTIQWELCHCM